MGRQRYGDNSRYFVEKGFAVFVPTRIGYGVTGGDDVEYSGACNARNYPPAYEAAAQQSLKVLEHLRTLAYVDAQRGLLVGQSFGGATSLALAAGNPPGVLAAVNFAGGGGGNPTARPGDPCRADLLRKLFAGYGATARIPTLWLYSENDKYFGREHPQEWFKAFVAAGGKGEFVQLPAHGEDGHPSFTRIQFRPQAGRGHQFDHCFLPLSPTHSLADPSGHPINGCIPVELNADFAAIYCAPLPVSTVAIVLIQICKSRSRDQCLI